MHASPSPSRCRTPPRHGRAASVRRGASTRKRPRTSAPRAGRSGSPHPLLGPALQDVRFTTAAQCAHGCGVPGLEGSVLSDMFAHPEGSTLVSALIVSGGGIHEALVGTLLQTCSVASGARRQPEVILWTWDHGKSADAQKRREPESGQATASAWLGNSRRLPPKKGWADGEEGLRGFPAHLESHVKEWCKPRADTFYSVRGSSANMGHGQLHSKFGVLHFVPKHSDGTKDKCGYVRVFVSSSNFMTGQWGGMPDRRHLGGSWWFDFDVASAGKGRPAYALGSDSQFGAALLRHVDRMFHLRSKSRTSLGGDFDRLLHSAWAENLRPVLSATAFGHADANGVCLIASEPYLGTDSKRGRHTLGAEALGQAWALAHATATQELDVAIVCHSINGWADKGDHFSQWRRCVAGAASLPVRVRIFWPMADDPGIPWTHNPGGPTGALDRQTPAANDAEIPMEVPATSASAKASSKLSITAFFPRVDGASVHYVISDDEAEGAGQPGKGRKDRNLEALQRHGVEFVRYRCRHCIARPHLMLYLLHDRAPPHAVRRCVVGSHNFSAAAWGRWRCVLPAGGSSAMPRACELRSFELSVSFPPRDGRALVDALPFDLGKVEPCRVPLRLGGALSY